MSGWLTATSRAPAERHDVSFTWTARKRDAEGQKEYPLPGTKKLIAFTLYAGCHRGPGGPLTVLRNLAGRGTARWVVGEHLETVATDTPLRILPAKTFAEVPNRRPIVPGGGPATIEAMHTTP